MKCKFCTKDTSNLVQDKSPGKHFFCRPCGAHYYSPMKSFLENTFHEARWYTRDEWDKQFLAEEKIRGHE